MVAAADHLIHGTADAQPELVVDAVAPVALTSRLLSEAVVLWTGKALALSEPDRDDLRVLECYGDDGPEILQAIRSLRAEFDETVRTPGETRWLAADRAAAVFAGAHPELAPAAVEALRWSYAFAHRHMCDLHGVEF
jgi:hypothetical protein